LLRKLSISNIFHVCVVNSFQNSIFRDDSQRRAMREDGEHVVNSFQNSIFKHYSQHDSLYIKMPI